MTDRPSDTDEPTRGASGFQLRLEFKRMSREERRAQTRERLLDAAARVFARQGFAATTLDQVAEAAGYTKGAVYSNFESKSDLFVALIERRIAQQAEEATRALERSTLEEAFRQTAEAGEPEVTDEIEWMALACEFWLYARHDERARQMIAEQYEHARTLSATLLEQKYAQAGMTLPIPARDFAILSEALGIGLLFQHIIDPAHVPMTLLNSAVLRLLGQAPTAEGARDAAVPAGQDSDRDGREPDEARGPAGTRGA